MALRRHLAARTIPGLCAAHESGATRGGDTLFADMEAAYDGLPDEIKTEIDGQVARHDFDIFRRALVKQGASEAEVAEFDAKYPSAYHPVGRTHPDTGRRSSTSMAPSLARSSTWTRREASNS